MGGGPAARNTKWEHGWEPDTKRIRKGHGKGVVLLKNFSFWVKGGKGWKGSGRLQTLGGRKPGH